jgi:hypothetical protein
VNQTVDVQQVVGYETQTRTTTRQVPDGQRWVSGGGSGTTVGSWQTTYRTETVTEEIEVPIYDSVQVERTNTVSSPRVITNPSDPMVGTTVNSYEIVNYEERTREVPHEVPKEEYEGNPGLYPDAVRSFRPGPPKTAKITEVAGTTPKTILVDYDGNTFDFDGSLNGVTFVDGNIKSLEGISKGAQHPEFADGETFQGRYIVANPAFSSKGIMTLADDILQFYDGDDGSLRGTTPNTLKVGERSPNSQHGLGLVSRQTFLKPTQGDELNIYAVMIAGHSVLDSEDENNIPEVAGGFGSHPSIMTSGYGFNVFNLYGGLIQANQQLWHEGGNGLTGNFTYDPAVAGDLPRFPRSNLVTTLRYADRYVNQQDAI